MEKPARIVPYRILTPRLLLRPWSPDDGAALQRAIDSSLEELKPFMPWAHKEPLPPADRVQLLRKFRSGYDRDEDYTLAVSSREGGEVLGSSGFHARIQPQALEIGYWMATPHARQGLTREAVSALVRVGFELLRLEWIEIRCDPANVRSAAIPKALGFTHDATLRRRLATHVEGELRDAMVWSLFRDEYDTSAAARLPVEAFGAGGEPLPLRPPL